MTLSYQWLCEYLPVRLPATELSGILTSVGLEVEHMEEFETIKGGLQGLVVGKVLTCIPHPNADKLKCTTVDIGSGTPLQIVCGAPNVAAGQTVMVAPVGTVVHPVQGEPFEIKKAKIRGELSEGMICAEDEVGLGTSHDGILLLPDHLQAGLPLKEHFGLAKPDTIFEVGITPNRVDAMSHLGAARDICAYLTVHRGRDHAVQFPETQLPNPEHQLPLHIDIKDPSLCKRYAGICLENITVESSPEWLQHRLQAIGIRPINNVVDITNYVLHETGQPLHAFDYDQLSDHTITIQTLPSGTPFITLDEQERTLSEEDIMICDSKGPVCMAGIYGGKHSGVNTQTQRIFLESAWFNNRSIRRSSLRHQLRTDAAQRFEKGADVSKVLFALQRAATLLIQIAGARIASPIMDVFPGQEDARTILFDLNRLNQLSGKQYEPETVQQILEKLDFKILNQEQNRWTISVPFAKHDVHMQADVVEEIMRIDGLDQIPFTGKIEYSIPDKANRTSKLKEQMASYLVGKGLQEIFTNSITNSRFFEGEAGLVKMLNNLSAELDCLRPSMLETGLTCMAYNLNRKNKQLQLFEFGKVYRKEDERFVETEQICMYFCGHYRTENWKEKPVPVDFYYVKGILESLLQNMNIEFKAEEGAYQILFRKKKIGQVVEVDATRKKIFDIRETVWFVEMEWQCVEDFYTRYKPAFRGLPRFPDMQRDVSMIIDRSVRYDQVQAAVKQAKSSLLKQMDLFDVFESDKLGENKKSYAINLSFYHDEKTLTDQEVEIEINRICDSLEQKLGAQIRKN